MFRDLQNNWQVPVGSRYFAAGNFCISGSNRQAHDAYARACLALGASVFNVGVTAIPGTQHMIWEGFDAIFRYAIFAGV